MAVIHGTQTVGHDWVTNTITPHTHTHTHTHTQTCKGFPGDWEVKHLPANSEGTRDASFIPGVGRSPEEGNDNPA